MQSLVSLTHQTQATGELRNICSVLAALDGRLEEADHRGFGFAWATWGGTVTRWRGIQLEEQATSGENNLVDRILTVAAAASNGEFERAVPVMQSICEKLDIDFEEKAHIAFVSLLLEVAVQLQDHSMCERLYNGLTRRDLGTPLSNFVTRPLQTVMGDAAFFLGKYEEARRYFEEALAICERIGHRPERAIAHVRLADLMLDAYPKEQSSALQHLDVALPELEAMGMERRSGVLRFLVARIERAGPTPNADPDGLSIREVEVLRLVAAGRSNAQIADQLVISVNTVQHHVSSILAKTGCSSRTEAASYAHRRGLIVLLSSDDS